MKTAEELAEKHWKYTGGILEIILPDLVPKETVVKLSHYLYVKVWIHAVKHGAESK